MCPKNELSSGGRPKAVLLVMLLAVVVVLSGYSRFWRKPQLSPLLAAMCPSLVQEQPTSPVAEELLAAVEEASEKYLVDQDLLLAVMAVESRCSSDALSRAGAIGVMQLMPSTARWLGVEDPESVRDNILGGAKYMALLLEQFSGDLELALAAYNAGPTNVRKFKGIPPYRETRQFVAKVLKYFSLLNGSSATVEV